MKRHNPDFDAVPPEIEWVGCKSEELEDNDGVSFRMLYFGVGVIVGIILGVLWVGG